MPLPDFASLKPVAPALPDFGSLKETTSYPKVEPNIYDRMQVENPDLRQGLQPGTDFLVATRGLGGILSDAVNAVNNRIVEPGAAALLNDLKDATAIESGQAPPARPAFVAGKSVIPEAALPLAKEKGVIPALTRTLQGFTTPGSLVTLPLAGMSKAVQSGYLLSALSSVPGAVQNLAAAQPGPETADAATELAVNLGMAGLMGREHGGEIAEQPAAATPAEPAKAAPAVQPAPVMPDPASMTETTPAASATPQGLTPNTAAPVPAASAVVRTPDGAVDPVQTALSQMRAGTVPQTPESVPESAQTVPPAAGGPTIADRAAQAPDKPVTMADLAQLQAEMRGNQITPSEPKPVTPATAENSQPGAGTTVSPAPAASDYTGGKVPKFGIGTSDLGTVDAVKSASSLVGKEKLKALAQQFEAEGKSPELAMEGAARRIVSDSRGNTPPIFQPEVQAASPDPNWRVTVQADQSLGNKTVPGYVQIDDVSGGQNQWSKSPQTLAKEGVQVPDFSKLPQGTYTYAEAVKKLSQPEVQAVPAAAKLDFFDKLDSADSRQKAIYAAQLANTPLGSWTGDMTWAAMHLRNADDLKSKYPDVWRVLYDRVANEQRAKNGAEAFTTQAQDLPDELQQVAKGQPVEGFQKLLSQPEVEAAKNAPAQVENQAAIPPVQTEPGRPAPAQSFKVGDKVIHQGAVKTVTKAVPGAEYVGVGKRAVKVSELQPAVKEAPNEGRVAAMGDGALLDAPKAPSVESQRESQTAKTEGALPDQNRAGLSVGREKSAGPAAQTPTDLASALLADADAVKTEQASLEKQRQLTGGTETKRAPRNVNGNLAYADQYR
ncbi:MAG: hypothetical protein KGL39_15585, partial [Patescibacteria group bacterium]|nr:hypothetical protein [Patescibacteria group bacterium]